MKELSIEEKAKAYDEAIEKAKDMLSYKEVRREDMEYLFPELKESEDEKIRKSIIAIINNYVDNSNTFKPKMIAWLEKQKIEKQGKQKPAWSEEDERMYRGLHNLIYSTQYCDSRKELSDWLESIKDRVQPKQEWSEEDEKILKEIITDVKFEGYNNDLQANSYRKIRWLKSLRPQNNKERGL